MPVVDMTLIEPDFREEADNAVADMVAKLQQFKPLPQIVSLSAKIDSHVVLASSRQAAYGSSVAGFTVVCPRGLIVKALCAGDGFLLEAQKLKHLGAGLCRPACLFQLPGQHQLNS